MRAQGKAVAEGENHTKSITGQLCCCLPARRAGLIGMNFTPAWCGGAWKQKPVAVIGASFRLKRTRIREKPLWVFVGDFLNVERSRVHGRVIHLVFERSGRCREKEGNLVWFVSLSFLSFPCISLQKNELFCLTAF